MTSETPPLETEIAGIVTGVSISHDEANVEEIEAATPADPPAALASLAEREPVLECLLLTTCNRVEWFVVTENSSTGRDVLGSTVPDALEPLARWFDHDGAIEHLIRVGAGLESMVLGEDEILGQLRDACQTADDVGTIGPILDETVWKAIHCGERVRTETRINEGVTSLGRAAVHQASEAVDLIDATAIVVGAGDMATVVAQSLVDAGVSRLTVANRTPANARTIASAVAIEANAIGLDDLPGALRSAEVVVTATASPQPVVDESTLAGAGHTVIVDIAQPRDVSPKVAHLDTVTHYDLDDVKTVTRETNAEREAAATIAEEMVDAAVDELQSSLKRQQADEVIAKMYAGAEQIKHRELQEAVKRLSAGNEPPEAVLVDFADAMVGHLLAAPTKSLRDAAAADDWETIQTALQLFDPDFPDGRVTAERDGPPPETGSDPSSAQR